MRTITLKVHGYELTWVFGGSWTHISWNKRKWSYCETAWKIFFCDSVTQHLPYESEGQWQNANCRSHSSPKIRTDSPVCNTVIISKWVCVGPGALFVLQCSPCEMGLMLCVRVCLLLTDDPQNNRRVLDDTVVLHNARPEDTAVYQCSTSNSHGSLLANINIMVMSEYYSSP